MATPGRTTAEKVRGIIEVDESLGGLDPFIDAANELVTEICAPVTTYTPQRLELIERWLAAHLYAIEDPRAQREKVGTLGFTAQSKVDLGFDVTHYGQTAMRLDTNGGLAAMNNAMKVRAGVLPGALKLKGGLKWAGTPFCKVPGEGV